MAARKFETNGVNHIALVCRDMQATVDFYGGLLGFPLTKTIELPRGEGQHFFFDIGNGDSLAFFWFRDNPESIPGVTTPESTPGVGEFKSAVGTMNHLAFDVSADQFEGYRRTLKNEGVKVGPILNHDDSEYGVSRELTDEVYVRSFYFQDPDGNLLEFASWLRRPTGLPAEVGHAAATAADRAVPAVP